MRRTAALALFLVPGLALNFALAVVLTWRSQPPAISPNLSKKTWIPVAAAPWTVVRASRPGLREHWAHQSTFATALYLYDMDNDGETYSPFVRIPIESDWQQPSWSGYKAELLHLQGRNDMPGTVSLTRESASGLPLLAFASVAKADGGYAGTDLPIPIVGGAVTVPWRPIWFGLIVNSLVYALGLCLAVRLVKHLPRVARTRRGLCLRCGYDLAGLERCPECGDAK